MHVILISKGLCFVFHFFIVKRTPSSLNLQWLKRLAQVLYFVLSTDVVNTMLVSISLVHSSAVQVTEKNKSFLVHTYLVTSYFVTSHPPVQSHITLLILEQFLFNWACRASTEIDCGGSNRPITAVF